MKNLSLFMAIDEIKDNCGICVTHTLHDCYNALKALQHRGQDSVGIAVKGEHGIDILRWYGGVENFSRKYAEKILRGDLFIGHVRYSTTQGKSKNKLFDGAHPRFMGGSIGRHLDLSHFIVRGANQAIVQNRNLVGISPKKGKIDTDVMLEFYSQQNSNRLEKTIQKFPAAYASSILDMREDDALIFRDRYGVRPLWVGKKWKINCCFRRYCNMGHRRKTN